MNIARNFLVTGVLYLLIGLVMGMYMGGSGDRSLTPVHAHINLLGFTLMVLFSVIYKVFPQMTGSGLAQLHFWLFQIGTLLLLVALFLMLGGFVPEATIGPVMSVTELIVLVSILIFSWNAYRHAV